MIPLSSNEPMELISSWDDAIDDAACSRDEFRKLGDKSTLIFREGQEPTVFIANPIERGNLRRYTSTLFKQGADLMSEQAINLEEEIFRAYVKEIRGYPTPLVFVKEKGRDMLERKCYEAIPDKVISDIAFQLLRGNQLKDTDRKN